MLNLVETEVLVEAVRSTRIHDDYGLDIGCSDEERLKRGDVGSSLLVLMPNVNGFRLRQRKRFAEPEGIQISPKRRFKLLDVGAQPAEEKIETGVGASL